MEEAPLSGSLAQDRLGQAPNLSSGYQDPWLAKVGRSSRLSREQLRKTTLSAIGDCLIRLLLVYSEIADSCISLIFEAALSLERKGAKVCKGDASL